MAIEQDNVEERQARLDAMIAEFRAAQQRRLVKAGKALWRKTEEAHRSPFAAVEPVLTLN
jgi:hypothetical protein